MNFSSFWYPWSTQPSLKFSVTYWQVGSLGWNIQWFITNSDKVASSLSHTPPPEQRQQQITTKIYLLLHKICFILLVLLQPYCLFPWEQVDLMHAKIKKKKIWYMYTHTHIYIFSTFSWTSGGSIKRMYFKYLYNFRQIFSFPKLSYLSRNQCNSVYLN